MPETTELSIISGAVVILAILIYRLLRREPLNRIVRLGLFIERKRFGDEDPKPLPPPTPPPPLPPAHEDEVTWPQREETGP